MHLIDFLLIDDVNDLIESILDLCLFLFVPYKARSCCVLQDSVIMLFHKSRRAKVFVLVLTSKLRHILIVWQVKRSSRRRAMRRWILWVMSDGDRFSLNRGKDVLSIKLAIFALCSVHDLYINVTEMPACASVILIVSEDWLSCCKLSTSLACTFIKHELTILERS